MAQDLLIFPYSGTALEALDCLSDQWHCMGFVSDDASLIQQERYGIKIYDRTAFTQMDKAKVLAIQGGPASFLQRQSIIESLQIPESRFATVIHPKAAISPRAKLGYNVLIMAGVVITANAEIGNHVVVLPNSVIHHDTTIQDYTLVAANVTVAGNVNIGKNCYLGSGSTIKNGITLEEATLVGMGANVVKSFSQSYVLTGNPAKPFIKK